MTHLLLKRCKVFAAIPEHRKLDHTDEITVDHEPTCGMLMIYRVTSLKIIHIRLLEGHDVLMHSC